MLPTPRRGDECTSPEDDSVNDCPNAETLQQCELANSERRGAFSAVGSCVSAIDAARTCLHSVRSRRNYQSEAASLRAE
jgi:hypothetical protein